MWWVRPRKRLNEQLGYVVATSNGRSAYYFFKGRYGQYKLLVITGETRFISITYDDLTVF